ncbi:hypothetical protein KIN20_000328 [Parelaphostrongylus tenuis]|uniref:Uncharacterized protein n=1 Tax=Parelaphostrongylus tenuis TaxID=148309 RepID=A0AAD5QBR9_PARTN|nr:hypothetical protein KIN20_000328 [Parelaphostrongylus tenuis]
MVSNKELADGQVQVLVTQKQLCMKGKHGLDAHLKYQILLADELSLDRHVAKPPEQSIHLFMVELPVVKIPKGQGDDFTYDARALASESFVDGLII